MYECDWNELGKCQTRPHTSPTLSLLSRHAVRRTSLLHWQEHCVECAGPECFRTCLLYIPRVDGECQRFAYGIHPNLDYKGLFEFGADVSFRRWGRLGAKLDGGTIPVWLHRLATRIDLTVQRYTGWLSGPPGWKRPLTRALAALREPILKLASRSNPSESFDAFVLECFSPQSYPVTLLLEIWSLDRLIYRHSFVIETGQNFHEIPADIMNVGGALDPSYAIVIYPQLNIGECRLVFTWLDFVVYSDNRISPESAAPAAKVKCVAWDLDETLWKGILSESRGQDIRVNPDAAQLVKELDQRGFLQTVVSKNDYDEAWPKLEALGLAEYFLHPAINWNAKSKNLTSVSTPWP